MLDNDEVETRRGAQREQHLSPFGQYLYVICALLGINENRLAQTSRISTAYFYELMRPPRGVKKSPRDDTVAAVRRAVETLAVEQGVALPEYWITGLWCSAWIDRRNDHAPGIRRIAHILLSKLVLMAKAQGKEIAIPTMTNEEIRLSRLMLGQMDSYLRDIERSR